MNQDYPKRVTYTPAEFAAVFGKERTWAYRQLYAGKINAISEYGRTLIPQSEVDRLLQVAGRYLGANVKPQKPKAALESKDKSEPETQPAKNANWLASIKNKKQRASSKTAPVETEDNQTPSPKSRRSNKNKSQWQLARQRLIQSKD